MTTQTSLVTGVDFVALPTRDLQGAMDFYSDTLRLPRSSVYQRGSGPAMGAEFETGNLTISLIDSEAMGLEYHPSRNPIALHVEDVEAARSELESRGLSFDGSAGGYAAIPVAPRAAPVCGLRRALLDR